MDNEKMDQLVAQAVGQQFDQWASQHPALAAAIDRVTLTDQVAQSLRASPQYRQAVAAYHQAQDRQALSSELLSLAGELFGNIFQ